MAVVTTNMVCRILSTMGNRNKVEDCPLSCLNNKNDRTHDSCVTSSCWIEETLETDLDPPNWGAATVAPQRHRVIRA